MYVILSRARVTNVVVGEQWTLYLLSVCVCVCVCVCSLSTYGGEERRIQGFGGGPEGKNHLEDLGVDGRIILEWIIRKWVGET
jgi:hypothetical protein